MTLAPPPGSLGLATVWRGRWRARWRGQVDRGVAAWSRLAANERRLLVLCALVVAGAGSWLAVIEPALGRIERSREELRRLERAGRELQDVLRQAGPALAVVANTVANTAANASSTAPSTAPPAAVSADALDRWLAAAGLAGRYHVALEDGAWRVTFRRAPAGAVAAWLLAGPAPLPLGLAQVALQRQDEAEAADPGAAPGEGLAGSVLLRPLLQAHPQTDSPSALRAAP
ncbi:type II secretion system protein GspM [Achromobacter sp. DH1f]|uniref:type II secretion system protein GspM n=1 Tax=Achromobacter sp. DH1f TaxID=1397275 RepID=UPI000A60D86D|nr:type II secretion system protein GspM [Achromobacter sp. DH1f]